MIFFVPVILAIAFFVVTIWVASAWFDRTNFGIGSLLVLVIMLPIWRAQFFLKQTWKRLYDLWLKPTGVPALSIGGFAVVGLSDDPTRLSLMKMALTRSQLSESALLTLYLAGVLAIGVASLLAMVGKSMADTEESQTPQSLFIAAFLTAWLGNLVLYSVFVDAVLLTIAARAGRAA